MEVDLNKLMKLSKELHILYVEDNKDLQMQFMKLFERFFFSVTTADNGVEGLEKYKQQYEQEAPYDLVITDINMPQMDGIVMSQEIIKISSEQKILILSAYNEVSYLTDAIDIGVYGFITKPIKNEQLFQQLYSVCSTIHDKKKYQMYIENIELQNRVFREKERAKKLTSIQEEFLRNISHEIKTPLNALTGFTSIIRNHLDSNSEKVSKSLNAIEENSFLIEKLTNRILQLSKLQSGIYALDKDSHTLKPLLLSLIEEYTHKASEASITFNHELDNSLNVEIECDVTVVKTVLSELLDNGIKFNKKDGKLALRVAHEDALNELRIEVKDNGVGIETEKCTKIFDMFYQADGSMSRTHEGAGVGLSLVKYMVELNEGKVTFESEKDQGSFFHVSIPVQ